jgi:hypothetical protein
MAKAQERQLVQANRDRVYVSTSTGMAGPFPIIPPIEVNKENEWEIEKILASRKCDRRLYRLVVSGEGSNQESEGQLQLSRFQERRLLRRIDKV